MPRLTVAKTKTVYLPEDEDNASVIINYLKPGIRRQIEDYSNDVKAVGSEDSDVETQISFNFQKRRKLFFEKVVNDWDGFLDKNGKKLQPTIKNILLFDDELAKFYEWLRKESDTFNEEVEAEKEESEKN